MPMDLAAFAPLVAVSPHLDDVVLSSAGLLGGAADATVITVFAGFPPPYVGVTEWDEMCGFGPGDDVVGIRRAEDRAALAVLGSHPVWLDFVDEQYVTELATSEEIAERLRAELSSAGRPTIAFPLGLSHTDHERTHEACVRLLEETPDLAANWIAFTDVPYRALHSAQAATRVENLRAMGYDLEEFRLDPGALKAAALAEYPSQLKGLAPELDNAALPEQYFLLHRH
jgi:LmbE family N-acetylglucosaminyl deacetylase